MKPRTIAITLGAALLLAGGGGALWYFNVPHSAAEQLALAEKQEADLRTAALTQAADVIKPQSDRVLESYRRVAAWKDADKTETSLEKIEGIEEEILKQPDDARATLDEIIKAYPDEPHAGNALLKQGKILRAQADSQKADHNTAAPATYRAALEPLKQYLSRFPTGPQGDKALIEQGRIWQDGIGDPLANAIAIYQNFLKTYDASEYVPEALYRLAQLMQLAGETKSAMELYGQILEKYPKSAFADKALFERGKLLAADKKSDAAAKDFDKLAQDFPDSPLKGQAQGEAREAKQQAAQQKGEKYTKGRYGSIPYDTTADKPLPPSGMFKIFAAEKLDAQTYDLNLAFTPSEHRLSVKGTLALINRGSEKTQLLLMLGNAMHVTKCTIDGTAATNRLRGVQWEIDLPKPLPTGASTLIAFEYTGQMAPPHPTMGTAPEDLPGSSLAPRGEPPTTQPGATPTTAPAPEDAPAATQSAQSSAIAPSTAAATQPDAETAATAPAPDHLPYDPQLALGDYGYGLSGGNFYPITIIGDLFNCTVHATVPAGMEFVCSGKLVDRHPGTDGHPGTFDFATTRPIFGLYFAYGNYVMNEKTIDGVPYYTYLKPAEADKTDAYIDTASAILNFYAQRYTKFPYEKLALVEVPLPPFLGGVGPASLMFLHQNMVRQHDTPEFLLAHELAHQWFGNLIPINLADPGYNQWLSEGFATYSDALYEERNAGPAALARHMEKYAQLYFETARNFSRAAKLPIRDTFQDSPLYRPMIYEKGATVLHALRKLVGDDKFFTIMRRYVTEYQDKPTTVDDFRHLAAQVAGRDLSTFFAEWLDRPGAAHWQIQTVTFDPATPPANASAATPTKVTLHIIQPDDLIVMPADITYHGAAGQEFVQKDVDLNAIDQDVTAAVPFRPTKIVIDEEHWILHDPGDDNVWTVDKPAPGQ
jgi:TolA-binding protein